MKNQPMLTVRSCVAAGLIAVAGLMSNCTKSSEKADDTNESTTSMSSDTAMTDTLMAGPMGAQGDTMNSSSVDAPQQAPPDSISNRQRATVPAEIEVKVKR